MKRLLQILLTLILILHTEWAGASDLTVKVWGYYHPSKATVVADFRLNPERKNIDLAVEMDCDSGFYSSSVYSDFGTRTAFRVEFKDVPDGRCYVSGTVRYSDSGELKSQRAQSPEVLIGPSWSGEFGG